MVLKNKKKAAMQMSFAWIFAIIVGVFILVLAIFAVNKFINVEEVSSSAESSKALGILFNPLETSFETGKVTSLSANVNTRIYNGCNYDESFGNQRLRTSQEGINGWSESIVDIKFDNKYIFSDEVIEGKKFYAFSKPFEFPFKVSDLIYLSSSEQKYCFVNPPEDIRYELRDLNQSNFYLGNCPSESKLVCFGKKNCDVYVNYGGKYVEQDGERIYFEGDALMYAGIFSSKDEYECHVKRLMNRVENLAVVYEDKEEFLSQRVGCGSELKADLIILENLVGSFESSEDLVVAQSVVENLDEENENARCRLW